MEVAARIFWTAAFILAVYGNVMLHSPPPLQPLFYKGLWVSCAGCIAAIIGTVCWLHSIMLSK